MKKKGYIPAFSIIGVVFCVIAISVSLLWELGSAGDFGIHAQDIAWLRMNSAIESFEEEIRDDLSRTLGLCATKAGQIPEGTTINPYLEMEERVGWEKILENISLCTKENTLSHIRDIAHEKGDDWALFTFDSNITLAIDSTQKIEFLPDLEGPWMSGKIKIPEITITAKEGWSARFTNRTINARISGRLHDMYLRARDFHSKYPDRLSWTLSGALYLRAYLSAYITGGTGPYLYEGDFQTDPVATILFGKIEEIEELIKDPLDSITGIGAIPAATWLSEWEFLSEPSFLPPGVDMDISDYDQAKTAIMGTENPEEVFEETCEGDSSGNCLSSTDLDTLEEEALATAKEMERYEKVRDLSDDWLSSYSTTRYHKCDNKDTCEDDLEDCNEDCCEMYEDCEDDLDDCNDDVDECEDDCDDLREDCKDLKKECNQYKKDCKACKKEYCKPDYEYCKDQYGGYPDDKKGACYYSALDTLFGSSDEDICDDFRDDSKEVLSAITSALENGQSQTCKYKIKEGSDEAGGNKIFNSNEYGLGFNDVDTYCSSAITSVTELASIVKNILTEEKLGSDSCSKDNSGECISNDNCGDAGNCNVRCNFVSCSRGNDIYQCVGDYQSGNRVVTCSKGRDVFDTCRCRCRPTIKIVEETQKPVQKVYEFAKKTYDALELHYEATNDQIEVLSNIKKFTSAVESLDKNKDSFDIYSKITPIYVKYDSGDGAHCYVNPTYMAREGGVCADYLESAGLYSAQIAAAALITVFSGGAGTPLLDYAKDFFPVIFETSAKFSITESITDDNSRNILVNIAEGGGELYTYAPLEFEIYKEHEFKVESLTLGRIILYLYLPITQGGIGRAIERMGAKNEGESCPTE